VAVPLRVQGGGINSHDISDYWYSKFQFPTHLLDPDEFYVFNRCDAVLHYNDLKITGDFVQGLGVYSKVEYIMNNMVYYRLNKSSLFFRNFNNLTSYNISLFYPHYVISDLYCNVSSSQVNASLPTNRLWYHTINFTVSPESGIATVLSPLSGGIILRGRSKAARVLSLMTSVIFLRLLGIF